MTTTSPEEPSTRVTLGKVYDVVLQMKDELSAVPGQVSDHEIRLRAIEKYMWIWIGAAGVVGAGSGQILNALINR